LPLWVLVDAAGGPLALVGDSNIYPLGAYVPPPGTFDGATVMTE
jgi:hypothetical protein